MYIGEPVNILISSKCGSNIDDVDFSVYIYPDGYPNTDCKIDKENCIPQESGGYLCVFPPEATSKLPIAFYTIEVNVKTNGVIVKKEHAFKLDMSASAIDINTESNG